ncbi:hypothetical protein [Alicyclobacillus dauci]|uniref:Uncharacterized protein n=1 Tax=Alicyclobacillus dauci TaxID=1475485 RepID=A0ABY6Z2C0_9BACL|nr:hypothetical protein [Alicyclobacillus dauci]WAH36976.1 hypothetical protein NZD86_22930 [Alicyclobacillus dauci]
MMTQEHKQRYHKARATIGMFIASASNTFEQEVAKNHFLDALAEVISQTLRDDAANGRDVSRSA